MMKKRIVLYGTLAIVVGVIVGTTWFGQGVTLTNYYRISAGSTIDDVQELLGPIEGVQWRSGTPLRVSNQGWIECWQGYTGSIILVYDVNGRVVEKEWRWDQRKRFFLDDLFGSPQVRDG
jgi:hypothetical protein